MSIKKILLWILVGLLSLGQLQRIELTGVFQGINFYLHDLVIIFFIFHVVFTNFTRFTTYLKKYWKNKKIETFFICFAVFSVIINYSITPDFSQLLYILRLTTYIFFGFTLRYLVTKKEYKTEYLQFQVFSVGLLALILGFLQYLFIQDTRFLSILGWDDHFGRLIGSYFDPGFTGLIFLLTLLIGLKNSFLQHKALKLLLVITFSWGIVLTFSRATYLALLLVLVLISLDSIKKTGRKIKQFGIGLSFFLVLIFLAPKPYGEGVNLLRTSTIIARATAIQEQLQLVSVKTFLIGNGVFSQKNSLTTTGQEATEIPAIIPSHSRIPDNIFINVLLSTGVIGVVLFSLLLIKWSRELSASDIYVFAGFAALILHSQFSNSLLQPFVLLIFLASTATIKKT